MGASAGLCLYPDQFGYRYGNLPLIAPPAGPAAAVLSCAIEGAVPVPAALPEVVWRAGIDLNPLDVSDPADVRWLETLTWPEQDDRRQRLAAAIAVARADPPHLVAGDLNDKIADVARLAPDDATAFGDGSLPPSPDPSRLLLVLAQDGQPVAYAGTHGQDIHWFE